MCQKIDNKEENFFMYHRISWNNLLLYVGMTFLRLWFHATGINRKLKWEELVHLLLSHTPTLLTSMGKSEDLSINSSMFTLPGSGFSIVRHFCNRCCPNLDSFRSKSKRGQSCSNALPNTDIVERRILARDWHSISHCCLSSSEPQCRKPFGRRGNMIHSSTKYSSVVCLWLLYTNLNA